MLSATSPGRNVYCDVPCDGAVAVVVSAIDAAKDMPRKPVLFEAVGTQIVERTDWDNTTMTHEPQVLGQSAHLWTRTSLRPKDVDVAELYDGFSFNCLSWLEALGFCGIGEAKDFIDGRRVRGDRREMNRLYVVESSPTITGAMADHRWRVRPSEIASIAQSLFPPLPPGEGRGEGA